MRVTAPILTLLIAAAPGAALASSSAWLESEGGRVRIVTTGHFDDAGTLQGALEVDLLPGWKTYWRDPGEAGVPPVVDLSKTPSVALDDIRFPAPKRFDDGYSKWAGYKHSVSLPLTFKVAKTGTAEPIAASVFIGICQTICIPLQGELSVDTASDADNAGDKAVVEAGVDALPAPASAEFGASIIKKVNDALIVQAQVPGSPETSDLFVASAADFLFGTPVRSLKDGKLIFSVPVFDSPEKAPDRPSFHYTLVSGTQAVEGVLSLP